MSIFTRVRGKNLILHPARCVIKIVVQLVFQNYYFFFFGEFVRKTGRKRNNFKHGS